MSLASVEMSNGDFTMEINTRFGALEVDPASLITFPHGLPGFEELKQFKLLHEEGKTTVFYLQSVEDPSVQFPLADPANFQVDYQIVLTDEDLALLELSDPSDATILVTLAKHGGNDTHDVHANFMGPIVLNTKDRIGIQKSLTHINGSVVIQAE